MEDQARRFVGIRELRHLSADLVVRAGQRLSATALDLKRELGVDPFVLDAGHTRPLHALTWHEIVDAPTEETAARLQTAPRRGQPYPHRSTR
jgi:hypothetical protein